MMLHNIWHNVLPSLSTISHSITSISYYHTLFPSLILSYHLHAGLPNTHSPTPYSALISPAQIIYPGMLYTQWNSSPATPSVCISHSTAHTTHSSSGCPFECCSDWPLHLVLPTFPHSQMTPPQIWMQPQLRKQVQAMWESRNTTNRLSYEFGKHLPVVLVNHHQIQSMCVACIWQRLSSSNIMSLHDLWLPWH